MPNIETYFTGKLNYDDHPFRVPKEDFIDALNITRNSEGNNTDEIVANIIGNELVPYTLPDVVNKTIGRYSDKVKTECIILYGAAIISTLYFITIKHRCYCKAI